MQGQRSSFGPFPETLEFDHGSSSNNAGVVNNQICWNNMQNSTQIQFSDYMISPPQDSHNLSGWSLGEASSSSIQNPVIHNEASHMVVEVEPQYDLSDHLSLNASNVRRNHMVNGQGPFFVQSSASDLNIVGPETMRIPTASSSSDPFGGPGFSQEGRRLSCKRKVIEGQSSGSGSSSCFQPTEGVGVGVGVGSSSSSSSGLIISNSNPQENTPRLGLAVGGASSDVLHPPGNAETARRNFRLRVNSSHQQNFVRGNVFPGSNMHGSLSGSGLVPLNNDNNNAFDLNHMIPPPGPSVISVPPLIRNPQSSNSRTNPRNISEHPVFLPSAETRTLARSPTNWGLAGGSTSVAGSSSGIQSSSGPNWAPHRNPSRYPRRLSEFMRRSLLTSMGSELGGQNGNFHQVRSGHAVPPPQDAVVSAGAGGQNSNFHHMSRVRSALLERQLEGGLGIPYSLRALAAASEGRSRLASEIRNVLDLMRRGEGLRFEDVMILDQSVFFGMPEIHDRHRDMRLDVDNMSYEELLALEERIGSVSTGLSEETVLNGLKQRKYLFVETAAQIEAEPCCICQEEYDDGQDLGTLDCGHDFHRDCIKQWLMRKNLCPICKMTGLVT